MLRSGTGSRKEKVPVEHADAGGAIAVSVWGIHVGAQVRRHQQEDQEESG